MQVQQAHGIGDGGAATANLLSDILLSQAELAGQAGVTLRLLDRTEISPLQIFYERELEDIAIARDAHDHRHLSEPELLGSAPTTFARDELVPSIQCPNHQGLNDSVLPDGFD
jgi:hypothetical protein